MIEKLQDLNFLHLFYFWMVVRHGGISTACEKMHVTQPTISTQIRKLEKSLGHPLFDRSGRGLQLTDVGKSVYDYADEMFSISREMLSALRGIPTERTPRLQVGVPMVMPKLITYRLLEPVLHMPQPVQIVCNEAPLDMLMPDLIRHRYDVILSDSPISPHHRVRCFNHSLGKSGVAICAVKKLAAQLRPRFPDSLDGAPLFMPTPDMEMRRLLDRWFDERGFSPHTVAELGDSALLKEFGSGGLAAFPIPEAVVPEVKKQYGVELVGIVPDVHVHFYAITLERKITNPAILAISKAAQSGLLQVNGVENQTVRSQTKDVVASNALQNQDVSPIDNPI